MFRTVVLCAAAIMTLLTFTEGTLCAQGGSSPPMTSDAVTPAAPTPGPASAAKKTQPATSAPAVAPLANPWVVNGLLSLLGLATLIFLGAFFLSVRKDPRFAVETSWGGFGGGLGGWTLSPSLVYLIATLALAGMLCMAVSKAASPASPAKDATAEAGKGAK
jgi:predicted lipid-binding transport protein (Tim44 family)